MVRATNFYNLEPDRVFNAIECLGLKVTGRYLQLNSYENRVFEIELDEDSAVNLKHKLLYGRALNQTKIAIIAKFYRPMRWSKEALLEEHRFLKNLNSAGIMAVSPYEFKNETLFINEGIYFTLFPKAYGRMPQELKPEQLLSIGRTLARLHNIGQEEVAVNRLNFDVETMGDQSLDFSANFIYPELRDSYFQIANLILDELNDVLKDMECVRIHGDCHKGNVLQTDPVSGEKEYFFVDFDDFCNGPVLQDFWMLLSDSKNLDIDTNIELKNLLNGYKELRFFDNRILKFIPLFRALRIIYYAGWIARRWEDPSFKQLFPQYLDYNYWAEEVQTLTKIWNDYSK